MHSCIFSISHHIFPEQQPVRWQKIARLVVVRDSWPDIYTLEVYPPAPTSTMELTDVEKSKVTESASPDSVKEADSGTLLTGVKLALVFR